MIGPTPGGTQTDIFKFTMEIFVYRWLLLVSIILLISVKNIIIPEFVLLFFIICFHDAFVYEIKKKKMH
jgi:hypothetical protein